MATESQAGLLFKRKVTKLANGARIEWDDVKVRKKIYRAIEKTNARGARKLGRVARSIVRQRAYNTGALFRSIKSGPIKHPPMKIFGRYKRAGFAWFVSAGGDMAPYVLSVEAGRYFKETGNRVPAVPFMRRASALTRKWLRPRMIDAIKRAIK